MEQAIPFRKVNFFDLPLEDVIIELIVPHLSLKDLFILRAVSKQFLSLVAKCFLKKRVVQSICDYGVITGPSFQVLTKDNSSLEVLKMPHCNLIGDDVLIPVLENNRKLKEIDLAYCQCLTSKCVHILSKSCQNLERLNLTSCKWLDSQTLMNLAIGCQKLVSINLSQCQLTEDGIVNFLNVCGYRLEDFCVAEIYGVTDRILYEIAFKCRSLISLDISNCWEMTNDGVRMIGMHCGNLKKLRITGCTKVMAASLGSLRNCLDEETLQMLNEYEKFTQFCDGYIGIPI